MNFTFSLHKDLLFSILVIFLLVFAITNFDGYYFYDDTTYAYYAYQITQGTFQIENPDIFAHRWGLIVPLAFSYKIFGISDFATILVPFLATLTSFFLFYTWLRENLNSPQKEIALLLFTLDFYTLFFANKLYPDVLLTTLVLGAVIVLWKRKNSFGQGLLFAFLNFWGYLCKETIIFIAPFYLIVFLRDIFQKKNSLFWIYAIIGAGIIAGIYLGIYTYFSGNPFYRFQIVQEGHNLEGFTKFNYFDKGKEAIIRRITYEPFLMLVNTYLIIALAGALVSVITQLRNYQKCNLNDFHSFNQIAFAVGIGMFWFMTTNFSHYNPIGLYPRHILFLVPLAAIISAEAICKKPYHILTAILMLISAVLAYQTLGWKVAILYTCLAVLWLTSNPKREGECMTSPPTPSPKERGSV